MNGTNGRTIRRARTAMVAALLVAALTTTAGGMSPASAATLVVTSGEDSGPGTLRQAVADAAPGDTITFAVGGVNLTSGQILLDKNLTIRGNGPAATTVRRAASTPRFRIFAVPAAVEATIDLLTVTGGDEVFGGGIHSGGRLTVARSRIEGNRGAVGAGIFNDAGDMTILNSAVSYNVVDTRDGSYGSLGGQGGGISGIGGSMAITGSEVVGNHVRSDSGGSGGGIDSHGTLSLTDSLVSSNAATHSGGGVQMSDGTVTGSVISDNVAPAGAGVIVLGVAVMERTEVSGNRAEANGGGIAVSHGNAATDLTATNVTVSQNSAANGAGLYVGVNTTARLRSSTVAANSSSSAAVYASASRISGGRYIFGTVTLRDTVVAAQTAGANCFADPNAAPIGDEGNNLTSGDATCGATIANADPNLGPLAANGGTNRTMALGGPAGIDAGSAACPGTDQRRFPRAGTCDIGAYEANAQLPDVAPPTCAVVPASGTLRDVVVQDGGRGLQQVVNVDVVNGWISVPPFFLPGTDGEVRVAVVQADPAVPVTWSFDVVDQAGNTRHCSSRTTTAVASSANPSSVGQAVTFTATVTSPMGTPTGTVTFSDGESTLGTATLAGGQAAVTTSALTAGDHEITATYGSDGFWSASSGSTTQTVNVAGADLSVSVADAPNPVSLGDTFTYRVTVSNSGPGAATATSATLTLTGVSRTVLSASATQGTCSVGSSITCSLGTVATSGTATIVVRVEPNATGTIGATATATSAEPDPNGPNQATAGTTVGNGHGCTILGTPGNDSIFGTSRADVICALGGDDAVSGGNGDDVIYAGSGDDRSHGESLLGLLLDNGSDLIYGGPGNDVLNGGNGNDRVVDTEGVDSLTGGLGNDTLVTTDGAGGDTVTGGLGTDVCTTDPNDTRNGC